MGKKSKRKAAKAAAVAAGTSTGGSNNGQQFILGPRPDGIVCTNEDHKLCAVCSAVLSNETYLLKVCCGTKICRCCYYSEGRCAFCKHPPHTHALTKKRAKEGFPWACHFLAEHYRDGSDGIGQSHSEAFRLYEIAASKDHPIACINLVWPYVEGLGCKKDLEKACIMFEKAMHLRAEDFFGSPISTLIFSVGYNLARKLLDDGEAEKGLSVFLPLAERGNGEAQGLLGAMHERVGDQAGSIRWHTVSSENPHFPFSALGSSMKIRNECLLRYWYGVASNIELESSQEHEANLLASMHDLLCAVRQECAWCNASLDRSNRKMCKGCKAHCYCSEDCQRAHWNAKENGHRSDCQKVMEVKKKVAAMKK